MQSNTYRLISIILNKYHEKTFSIFSRPHAMKHILCLILICSTLASPTLTSMHGHHGGVCPPCPSPPVHACCKADSQVVGTCCQVTRQFLHGDLIHCLRLLRNVASLWMTTFLHIVQRRILVITDICYCEDIYKIVSSIL